MASEYRKIMLMQIKNGVCLLCIFALMLLLAACFSLHTTQAEVRSFSRYPVTGHRFAANERVGSHRFSPIQNIAQQASAS